MPTFLRLYEDILAGGADEMRLPALPRMIFVVHGGGHDRRQDLCRRRGLGRGGRGDARPAQQGVTAWRFEVAEDGAAAGAIGGVSRLKLSAMLETLPQGDLLLRGDSVAFPPGGCAYLHRHQGPGIRCLIEGGIRIDTHGRSTSYGPGGAWYESGPDAVFAQGATDRALAVRARDAAAARAHREKLDPVCERRGQGETEVAVLQDLRRYPDCVQAS